MVDLRMDTTLLGREYLRSAERVYYYKYNTLLRSQNDILFALRDVRVCYYCLIDKFIKQFTRMVLLH